MSSVSFEKRYPVAERIARAIILAAEELGIASTHEVAALAGTLVNRRVTSAMVAEVLTTHDDRFFVSPDRQSCRLLEAGVEWLEELNRLCRE